MKKVFITGVGLNAEIASSLAFLSKVNVDSLPVKQPIENDSDLYQKNINFRSGGSIKREDRTLLNDCAKLSIDAATDAFLMAEMRTPYTPEEKSNFPIFMANESIENNFTAVETFSKNHRNENGDILWDELGKIKELLNPLDMLRLLSTNPLYHVSKYLGLHGGGYPIRRMSLSGLTALEEAFYSLPMRAERALVLGTGDLKTSENLCAFKKMSLLRMNGNENGIIPSYASAAIVLEHTVEDLTRNAYAELVAVRSMFRPESRVSVSDWKELYEIFPRLESEALTVICYNNGVNDLASEEYNAMRDIFPNAQLLDYKKYYGYTGKANNLIDLITVLNDKRVALGSYVAINGVGMSVGHGYILLRKLAHI